MGIHVKSLGWNKQWFLSFFLPSTDGAGKGHIDCGRTMVGPEGLCTRFVPRKFGLFLLCFVAAKKIWYIYVYHSVYLYNFMLMWRDAHICIYLNLYIDRQINIYIYMYDIYIFWSLSLSLFLISSSTSTKVWKTIYLCPYTLRIQFFLSIKKKIRLEVVTTVDPLTWWCCFNGLIHLHIL